jgi:hypothetical protein
MAFLIFVVSTVLAPGLCSSINKPISANFQAWLLMFYGEIIYIAHFLCRGAGDK